MPTGKSVSPAEAMNTLQRLLVAAWTPALSKAKPIVFDFGVEQWTLDPAHGQAMVRKGDTPNASLRLTSSPATLLRLLTDGKFDPAPFQVFASGNTDELTPIIEALRAKQNLLDLRAKTNKGA